MKRINSEQINGFVNNFLKRRNYNEINVSKVNRRPNKAKPNDMKTNNSLEEVALNGSLVNSSSDGDIISLSQSSIMASLAEISFKNFIEFGAQFKGKQRLCEQISQLEFPIFLYIFIDLLEGGFKISARNFFRDHKNRFSDSNELHLMEAMNKSLTVGSIDASLKTYKTNKFSLKISDKCLEQIKKYFKETNDLVIIQILNTCIEFNIYSTHSQTENERKFESMNSSVNKCTNYSELELISSNLKQMDTNSVKDNDLLNSIEKVRNSQPCLPSICLYTIDSSDLSCVSVTDDMVSIAMGFEDSSIRLKCLSESVSNRESDIEVKRNISRIRFKFIDYDNDNEDSNQSVNNGNNCDKSASTQHHSYQVLRGHSGPIYGLSFVPRTNLLLSCSCDTTVRAWDTTNGNNVNIFTSHLSPIWTIDTSYIGNHFCTGSKDSSAYLWSVERQFPLRLLCGHNMSIDFVKFHPNCNFIATASADKDIKIWDIQTARAVRTLSGHKASIYCLSFSSCGQYLASAGEDRRVIVWDLKSGELFKEFSGHSDAVYSVCFNHNNTILSSCGADQSLRLWNLKNTTNPMNKPMICDSENTQNINCRLDSDQLISYQLNANVIHSQFMPKNLLLSIANKKH